MSVKSNIKSIHQTIEKVAVNAGRDAAEVQLVAVSKVQPNERVLEALQAGQRVFGENRVQEAHERWAESGWREEYPDLCLHLIGPLQSNKAADAVALFDVIESVDREKIAKAFAAVFGAEDVQASGLGRGHRQAGMYDRMQGTGGG